MPKTIEFEVEEKTGCFNVTNVKEKIKINGRAITVQKHIYEQCFGEVPEGKQVYRKCGNEKCINPEHLILATKDDWNSQKRKPYEFVVDEKTGCFILTSHEGKTKVDGKPIEIYRIIYRECFGEPAEGKRIFRVCGNKRCINPEHMKAMTQSEFEQRPIEYEVDENGCHICTSHAYDACGYPKAKRNGKMRFISNLVYEEHYGSIPRGLVVRHKCDNPHCINPEHLEIGTQKDNAWDRESRGRGNHVHGSRVHTAKLTEDDVREIRRLLEWGHGISELARKYNVSVPSIAAIRDRKSWKHI